MWALLGRLQRQQTSLTVHTLFLSPCETPTLRTGWGLIFGNLQTQVSRNSRFLRETESFEIDGGFEKRFEGGMSSDEIF